jgi:lipopolysaccharide cholinephosphotransferase
MNIKLSLPEEFLEEEVRCDYTVSKEMKKVWAVELDLLAEFQRVCKLHDIKYSVCGGTLLGAIRHKGFIPWDDDIDVMMMREEYEKLCKLAGEFKHPYFFQTEETDPGSLRGHAQLRNSETTAILKHELKFKRPFNQGIFIDIFPLDNCPDNQTIFKLGGYLSKFLKKCSSLFANISVRHDNKNDNVVIRLLHKLFYPINKWLMDVFYHAFEFVIKNIGSKKSNRVSMLSVFYPMEKMKRKKVWMESLTEVPFENITVSVPSSYEEVLTSFFGNWHQFVKGGSLHGGAYFDTEHPYTYYTKGDGKF